MTDINALKHKRGVIDLDDLLTLTIDAFSTDPSFADSTRWRLRHFYVDEAQDLNPLQVALLSTWLNGREDLTLVGDPSQAIFGFNGADAQLLTQLETKFPGIEVVRLGTNYRCTPQIVHAGLQTLRNNPEPLSDLRSARPDGAAVEIYGFDDESAEASGIATLVASLHQDHRPWREIAILARTNAQLPPIRDALVAAGIPARLMTTQAHDPLRRVVREVEDLPSATRLSVWAKDIWTKDVWAKEISITDLPASDFPAQDSAANEDLALDSHEPINQREAEAADAEIRRRVARAVEEFLSDGGGDGRAFGAWVRANRPFEADVRLDAVELLTFHSAKGREWDLVIVAGCESGLMPHSSARSPASIAEEVRLSYVALTRAADRLVLTYARQRRGRRRERSPLIEGVNVRPVITAPDPLVSQAFRQRRATLLANDPVWEELESWRSGAGRAAQIAPQILCPDDVLRRIAARSPQTESELAEIDGVGQLLAGRAGTRILQAVSRGLDRRDAAAPN
jgi:DNA helicase-2/ATP-dependent DNA helicase PcrA